MTSTDTTTTAITSSFLATLSADWQNALSWLQSAEQGAAAFLVDVANGVEIAIERVEQIGQYVAGHLGIISTGITAISTVAAVVAPNNASVQKVISDLNIGAQDVAALGNDLTSGTTSANDPAIVTKAVTAIGAVKQLSQLVSQAGTTLATLTANAPNATQAVSPSTPAQG